MSVAIFKWHLPYKAYIIKAFLSVLDNYAGERFIKVMDGKNEVAFTYYFTIG